MTDDATILSKQDLQDILNGACFLGSGGGGPLVVGQALIDHIEASGRPVTLIPLAKVVDGATAAMSAGVGSPLAAGSGFPPDAPLVAWKALAQLSGKRLDVVAPCELGAGNTIVPFTVAAAQGIPVVDAAGANRAVPKLTMCTYAAHGLPVGTVVLANSDEEFSYLAQDPGTADTAMRALLAGGVFAEDAGSAMWAMSGAQLKSAAIAGTTTLALKVGQTLRTSTDPVTAVCTLLGGTVVVQGLITGKGEATAGGLDTGWVTITADDGTVVTVVNVNENVIAWSDRSGPPLVVAPDLLCYTTLAGAPFSNAEVDSIKPDEQVALVTVPATAAMRAPSIVAAFDTLLQSLGFWGQSPA